MDIQISQLLEGAKNARGLTVIIDVFRAFSTACYTFEIGATKIFPIGDISLAYKLKEQNPQYILIGERNEQKPPGFDFGNSPSQLIRRDLSDKTIVHTTSSGTQGITNATKADEIITGSFVNAGAIVRYIQLKQPETVSLVCMGYACEYPTDEDTFCAEYIKNELEAKPNDFGKMVKIMRSGSGARFFDKEKQEWSPQKDFDLCLDLNRFDFVLKVEREDDLNYLRRIDI
ncbi:MAG: 2-phosphosulfolactate phosphatase [Prolixibacteraceae bacterium]|nr:2-phosphosulfolactate phosphatase [Prolixibacteraceae bacterium]MBT6007557.1 2-phosphosulfolactate phosphatase [Prolixibacteraceae bacterium]MBT6767093.1 2-phosphosulfolactate phosphatase [Prolixibacteraceae bacterium]MBT7000105.1 2-phosphosulfolactate phosphatase [Prolixibacteraceae bacterium]MBT7395013.1 2-phosphosulfolactate phosphatase [Prolixibacteraceae bacterium]